MDYIYILSIISDITVRISPFIYIFFSWMIIKQMNWYFDLIMKNKMKMTQNIIMSQRLRFMIDQIANRLKESHAISTYIIRKTHSDNEFEDCHRNTLKRFDEKIDDLFKSLDEFDKEEDKLRELLTKKSKK